MAAGAKVANKTNSKGTKRVRMAVKLLVGNCVCFKDAAATQDDVLRKASAKPYTN
jgi:hypothetical protein